PPLRSPLWPPLGHLYGIHWGNLHWVTSMASIGSPLWGHLYGVTSMGSHIGPPLGHLQCVKSRVSDGADYEASPRWPSRGHRHVLSLPLSVVDLYSLLGVPPGGSPAGGHGVGSPPSPRGPPPPAPPGPPLGGGGGGTYRAAMGSPLWGHLYGVTCRASIEVSS